MECLTSPPGNNITSDGSKLRDLLLASEDCRPNYIDVHVEATFRALLAQEDLDGDRRITARDRGPKRFRFRDAATGAAHEVRGTYPLATLLQELALLREGGGAAAPAGEGGEGGERRGGAIRRLDLSRVRENPVVRINRGVAKNRIEASELSVYLAYLDNSYLKFEHYRAHLLRASGEAGARDAVLNNLQPGQVIREQLWDGLTRTIDEDGIMKILDDEKMASDGKPAIYAPAGDPLALARLRALAARKGGAFRALSLPAPGQLPPAAAALAPHGLLALAAYPCPAAPAEGGEGGGEGAGGAGAGEEEEEGGEGGGGRRWRGAPFVVPGGRFNEMYGWDSYFESLGLLRDGRLDLVVGMIDNFVYQIHHYGKILNANRTYYLHRSQPPLLAPLVRAAWEGRPASGRRRRRPQRGREEEEEEEEGAGGVRATVGAAVGRRWLRRALGAALREHEQVWDCPPRRTHLGLSRYYGTGEKAPPEVEPGHFDSVLKPFADALGLSCSEYLEKYQRGAVRERRLDLYFLHDQAVRESGHDTSNRLGGRAAALLTVDLNALLYRYETDVADLIRDEFGGRFVDDRGREHTHRGWRARAAARARRVDALLWDEESGTYFDYDLGSSSGATVEGGGSDDSDAGDPAQGRPAGRTGFESATMVYPLWAGMASPEQAARVADYLARRLEEPGGLVSTSEASRGPVTPQRPQRQWDYPFGWAPHQMMAWQALADYGYEEQAQRLAYRWLLMLTQNYSDYNGVIPEKYDVVRRTHDVFDVEYGNVGTDFEYITKEGFGWMNASYQVGLSFLTPDQLFSLSKLKPTENVFRCEQNATVVPASGEMQQGIMKTVLGKSESTITDNNKEEEDSKRIIMDTADDSAPSSFVAAGSSFSGEVLQPKKKKKEEQEHGGGFISSAFVPTTSCILF